MITAESLEVLIVALFELEPEALAFCCKVGFASIMMRSSSLSVTGDVTDLGVPSASFTAAAMSSHFFASSSASCSNNYAIV